MWTGLITETVTESETMTGMVWVEVRALALSFSVSVFISVCERASDCGLRLQQAVDLTLFRVIPGNPAVNRSPRQLHPREHSKENKATERINLAHTGWSKGEGTAKQNPVK